MFELGITLVFEIGIERYRERDIFSSLYNHTCTCQIIFENIQTKTEPGSHDR